MRVHLSNEVASVINDFGPKMYSDFDQVLSIRWSLRFTVPLAETRLSGEFLCPPPPRLLHLEHRAYGEERVPLVESMLKGWGSFILL